MQRGSFFVRQLTTLFILTGLMVSLTVGQKKSAQPKSASCSGVWTGNVTYTRSQDLSDSKTVKRVSNRGEDQKSSELKFRYKASVAVLEDRNRPGTNTGKASIESSLTSTDKTIAREENSCDRGKTWRVMTGEFITQSETRGQASHLDASVTVGANSDGSYAVSVGLPQIRGMVSGEEKASYSGQCTTKPGKSFSMPQTETTLQGFSMSTDGRHRVDAKDPNRISGSWSQTALGVTETITWNLQRCDRPLRITDIQFEDMKYPTWNDWQDVSEQRATIDGNLVRIKARILNETGEAKYADLRFKATYTGDKWNGSMPDAPLEDNVRSIRIGANTEETVEMIWDSSGYAWFDDGRPRLVQRIKAELEENGKQVDEKTENLKLAPKPVVLVHGLWSNWQAWEAWQNILTTSHSFDWKAFAVGEKPEHGRMNTGKEFMSTDKTDSIGDNARQLQTYVEYAQKDRNAWHVDIVAHSMGGLISRWYIDQLMQNYADTPRPRVAHLVMLGTPNMGSPCADVMDLTFEILGKRVEAVRQLRTDYIEGFNRIHTQRKGVKFSSLAGNPLPMTCKWEGEGDGVVTVKSAHWTIKDTGISNSIHTDLTGTKDFSDFVEPRLAIGPKGNHLPETPDMPGRAGRN
ncbi:MAG: lipase family alpha/beta hydrolase [Pyrinomonadaceae bacterium]